MKRGGAEPRSPLGLLRRKAGFQSQPEACIALGISRVWLAEIEAGRERPGDALVQRMAALYLVSTLEIAELLDRCQRRYRRNLDKLRRAAT